MSGARALCYQRRMASWWLVLFVSLSAERPSPQTIRELEASGQQAAALRLADLLVQEAPTSALARLEAGRLRLLQGEALDRAELDLMVALSLSPELPRAHYLHGQLMEAQGRDDAAVNAYRLALVYREGYDEARLRLASLHFARAQWAQAEAHYRELVRRQPDEHLPRLQLAATLERQGRPEEAAAVLVQLWEGSPRSVAAGRRLLSLYEATGQAEKAKKLRRALEEPPAKQMRPLKPSRR